MIYTSIIDSEGIAIRSARRFKLACCDCGLVHDMVITGPNKGGWIGLAMRRNKRATSNRRKVLAEIKGTK